MILDRKLALKSPMKVFQYILPSLLILSLISCSKDDDQAPVNNDPVSIQISLNYVFGSQALAWDLNQMMLHPKTGDSLNFQTLKFYLSNFKLQKADGSFWEEENSYHLVDAATSTNGVFSIEVPAGTYTHLHFKTGIDSSRITDGPYEGDLDGSYGMMFPNGSGYAMIKAEGLSPQGDNGQFSFALGEFHQPYSMVQNRSMSFFGEDWVLEPGSNHEISLVANPAKLWHYAPGLDSLSNYSGGGEWAELMSREFFGAISLQSVD